MEDILKALDLKLKLLRLMVLNRDHEAMLQRGKEREYNLRIKDISKILREVYNLKIKFMEAIIPDNEIQEEIEVLNQEMQSGTHVYKTMIEKLWKAMIGILNRKI